MSTVLIIHKSSDCQELSILRRRPHGGKPAQRARGGGGERASDSSADTTDSSGAAAKPRPGWAGATARGGVLAAGAAVLAGGERGRATGRATQGTRGGGRGNSTPVLPYRGLTAAPGAYTNVLPRIQMYCRVYYNNIHGYTKVLFCIYKSIMHIQKY